MRHIWKMQECKTNGKILRCVCVCVCTRDDVSRIVVMSYVCVLVMNLITLYMNPYEVAFFSIECRPSLALIPSKKGRCDQDKNPIQAFRSYCLIHIVRRCHSMLQLYCLCVFSVEDLCGVLCVWRTMISFEAIFVLKSKKSASNINIH